MSCAQGSPLDLLALEARGACDPGSHGTVNIGESVLGRSPPHGAAQIADKHTSGLSMKEAYLLALELQPKG